MRLLSLPAALVAFQLAATGIADPAAAQILLQQQPSYGLRSGPLGTGPVVIVNPTTLYNGATVATPGTYLRAAPTGQFPASPPCGTAQMPEPYAAPPPIGTFQPPITPSSSTFHDRFAAPHSTRTSNPNNSSCR